MRVGSALAVAATMASASIVSGCTGSSEEVTVPASVEQVTTAGAEALDVPTQRVVVDDPIELGTSTCRIHSVWDQESLAPHPLYLAELTDGTLLDGRADDTAGRTLDACFVDGVGAGDAEAMAQIVVMLAKLPARYAVLEPDLGRGLLDRAGVSFQPPSLLTGTESSVDTVSFLAEDLELHRLVRITATRVADGTVVTDIERL